MAAARKIVPVVAAVIYRGDCVFATQRGYGEMQGGWEFPGGKIEPGETAEQALCREIREELDCGIAVGELLDTVEHDYPTFHLSMQCFRCTLTEGEPKLLEHQAAQWVPLDRLEEVAWLPADRVLLRRLRRC